MNKKNLNHFIPFDAFFLFFFSQSIIYWHNGAIVIRPLVAAKLLRPVAARAVYVDINTKKKIGNNMKKMTAMITHIINSACSCFVCLNQRVCVFIFIWYDICIGNYHTFQLNHRVSPPDQFRTAIHHHFPNSISWNWAIYQ